ncbi:Uncharacterised protein [Mycobacteroides abscessus]|nr:Uncharacterised protein [Mycobacteroides abscessus]
MMDAYKTLIRFMAPIYGAVIQQVLFILVQDPLWPHLTNLVSRYKAEAVMVLNLKKPLILLSLWLNLF